MPKSYIKRILDARVYDVAIESPIDEAPQLSARVGNRILLKREDLQPVFSFKLRGAYNKIVGLSAPERERGVITASAGNHAQGVALAAQRLQIKALIVMPRTTPDIKVTAVRRRGARVVLHGDTFDEASKHAYELAEHKGLSFVHPYDDPEVIAGQGTIGMEILRQLSGPIDAVFVPVGGGGLLAGVAAYIKYVRPSVRVIGVEPEDAACLDAALKAKRRVVLSQVGIFADGVAVAQIGKETFRIIRQTVDEVQRLKIDIPRFSRSTCSAPGCRARRWWRSTAARTPTSTACATSPSAPRSASSARRCSTSPSRKSPAASARSATRSGAGARSPSSTTAIPTPARRRSSSACRYPRIAMTANRCSSSCAARATR